MFPIKKLSELAPSQRRRKIILLLAGFERSLLSGGSDLEKRMADSDLLELCRFAAADPKIPAEEKAQIERLSQKLAESSKTQGGESLRLRLCNTARNIMLKAAGTFPAEWDFIHPESGSAKAGAMPTRLCYKGLRVFLEDIRSPFNVGSIFRTAEAFGAEKLYLSPCCAPAEHPRARRSSMGSVDFLPWEYKPLEELPEGFFLFALETGGIPLDKFSFPEKGIVIVGSEELGVSPEALEKASSRVSIPLSGIKASLNVGVAFGILMQAWTRRLALT